NGAHLYAASGRLMVRQSNGETFPIEPAPEIPFQPAAPVSDVPGFTSPADPGNTIESIRSAYQLLRTDCQSGSRANLIELKPWLRDAGTWVRWPAARVGRAARACLGLGWPGRVGKGDRARAGSPLRI